MGAAWLMFPGLSAALRTDLVTRTVRYGELQRVVRETGTLESAANSEIYCKVKARSRGSTVATTLKWVIEDGTPVKQGDLLAALDDSALQEDLKVENITVLQAQAAWVQAEENLKIVTSQNEGDIQTAAVTLRLADLDLQKYVNGDYEQTHKDVVGRRSLAEADLEMWRDRVAWSGRMVRKGFLTASQALAERSRMEGAQLALDKVHEEQRVLEHFIKRRTVRELESKLAEAHRGLERVKSQALAKRIQAEMDCRAKRSVYDTELKRLHEMHEQVRLCSITAPHDGIVVHYVPDQSRYGSGAQQGVIAQGEPVREGQKLMQLPDLAHMVVDTRVHEAALAQVRGEVSTPTGFGDTLTAVLLATPNPWSALLSEAALDALHDRFRDREQRLLFPGEPALVQIHALPDRVLHGHVKHVSSVASQWDWMIADIKLYQTTVAIDEPVEGLRPGMSAEVLILTGKPVENALLVPVQALSGPAHPGEHARCFVLTNHGPQERDVVIGDSNETMVEVRAGLEEGEEVVLNPAAVRAEEEATHVSQ
jgi:multidrug efflux pump subunit AcrA (membrane-fusion protein)